MTMTELQDVFYTELDALERKMPGSQATTAAILADVAVHVADPDQTALYARLAFRIARWSLTTRVARREAIGRASTRRHQIAADHGVDTWEEWRGER